MPPRALSARKTPRQARSIETVRAILDASIQVLRRRGLDRLTTTAVAERANVSVGTLYQYFPNKRALLAEVLREHLGQVADAVVNAARRTSGGSRRDIVAAVVAAFVTAKFSDAERSRVLYAVAGEVGGPGIVRAASERARAALQQALASASDAPRDETVQERERVAHMIAAMMVGPVQEGLAADAPAETAVQLSRELTLAVTGYLEQRRLANSV